jgi:hypothetical protein
MDRTANHRRVALAHRSRAKITHSQFAIRHSQFAIRKAGSPSTQREHGLAQGKLETTYFPPANSLFARSSISNAPAAADAALRVAPGSFVRAPSSRMRIARTPIVHVL